MRKLYWDWDAFWVVFMATLTILFIIYGIAYSIVGFKTKKFCLNNGYANSETLVDFSQYCIREENEYEITVPLKEVLNR